MAKKTVWVVKSAEWEILSANIDGGVNHPFPQPSHTIDDRTKREKRFRTRREAKAYAAEIFERNKEWELEDRNAYGKDMAWLAYLTIEKQIIESKLVKKYR